MPAIAAVAFVAAVAALVAWLRARRDLSAMTELGRRDSAALTVRAETAEGDRAVLLQIMNGLGEALLAIDSQRHIVLANRTLVNLFRIDSSVSGRQVGELIRHPAVFNAFDRALQGIESTERLPVKLGVSERTIEIRSFPVQAAGIAAVALFIDVTQLERLETIRRNFISDFSHEVRTPLAGLLSAVETLEAGTEHLSLEEVQQLRRIMTRQLRRLERLVDDLAELSRIESGELALERSAVDLYALVSDLREDFADRLAQHDIRLSIEGERVLVCGDSLRLQQAISNLIDNAIKYGGDGKEILVEIARRNGTAILRVSDQGSGIPQMERENIFRRFYRIDKSRSQDVAGTGLGLAITKHLIFRHGGTIDVESEIGRGSTFIINLPVEESDDRPRRV